MGGDVKDKIRERIEELDAAEREAIYNLGAIWGRREELKSVLNELADWGRREELKSVLNELAEAKVVDIAGKSAETAAREPKTEKR